MYILSTKQTSEEDVVVQGLTKDGSKTESDLVDRFNFMKMVEFGGNRLVFSMEVRIEIFDCYSGSKSEILVLKEMCHFVKRDGT